MEDENLYKKAFDFVCDVVNKESPKMSDQLKRLMERKVFFLKKIIKQKVNKSIKIREVDLI